MQNYLKHNNTFELHIENADEILMLDFIKISTDRDYSGYVNSFSFNCHYLNASYEVKRVLKYDNLIKSYDNYCVKKKDIVSDGELYEIDSYTGKVTKILELKNIVLLSINEYEQYIDLYCDWCIDTGNYSNNIRIINYQPIDYQPTFRPQTINTYDDDYDDNMMLINNIDEYDYDEYDDEEYDAKIDKFNQSYKSILSRIKTLF